MKEKSVQGAKCMVRSKIQRTEGQKNRERERTAVKEQR